MTGGIAPARAAEGLADWISPARTALLIVDMQADFASPEGAMARAGADLGAVPAALAAASRLAAAAARAGVSVVYVGLTTTPATDSPAWAERTRRLGGVWQTEAALCRAGSPGADFHGPTPAAGDLEIFKTRYSGFFGTPLDATLRGRGVDTLVVCGLTTECCVDCTVRDAFHLDYQAFVVADACAAYDGALHVAALKALELNCAILVDAEQVAAAWREARHG